MLIPFYVPLGALDFAAKMIEYEMFFLHGYKRVFSSFSQRMAFLGFKA